MTVDLATATIMKLLQKTTLPPGEDIGDQDTAAVQARAVAGAEALRVAEEDHVRAVEEAAQKLAIVERRRREHQSDRELEAAIMLFAVDGSTTTARAYGAFMSTRGLAVGVLSDLPSREFSLEELVKAMQSRGYTGTHNAVLQLLLRGISNGKLPVQRVRRGFYKYRASDTDMVTLEPTIG